MSNIVHKIKDAVTDRDGPMTRSRASDDRNHGTSNPFTSDYNRSQNAPPMNNSANMGSNVNRPDSFSYGASADAAPRAMNKQGQYEGYLTNNTNEKNASGASRPNVDAQNANNANAMPGNTSSSSSSSINAGPHRTKMANKLDPRIDSDLDSSAKQDTVAPQTSTAGAQGIDSKSNMPIQQQPFNKGVDNHTSSEENFDKSTQEHRSHHEPGQYGFDANQAPGEMGEENYSSSTQEHRDHKTTSHVTPCPPRTMGSERMPENNVGQNSGNNTAPPSFGGNAAGGSSYNENMGARGPDNMQSAAPSQKLGTGTGAGLNRPPEQQDMTAGQQRAGY
ncbi:hypothetical protein N7462_006298 [Penicillium macrosclerotiorum]|uniref:uncharacterized protein n=1 Tax=Penicillium macrosclerotiorum TaxID=303699 RepID=UPI0025466F61|nr:uncharacterized protein N7462_006298 [Penicillium macrosclerotiorum]KAJ5683133.1 hypothetical protein N7462_006298 [Penicillium macrosclerotiorum]